MKYVRHIFALLLLSVFLISCKKDANEPSPALTKSTQATNYESISNPELRRIAVKIKEIIKPGLDNLTRTIGQAYWKDAVQFGKSSQWYIPFSKGGQDISGLWSLKKWAINTSSR